MEGHGSTACPLEDRGQHAPTPSSEAVKRQTSAHICSFPERERVDHASVPDLESDENVSPARLYVPGKVMPVSWMIQPTVAA